MTNEMMGLRALMEKAPDADLLRGHRQLDSRADGELRWIVESGGDAADLTKPALLTVRRPTPATPRHGT